MNSFTNFSRKKWSQLSPIHHVKINKQDLEKINAHGDVLDMSDVYDVYLPLIGYLKIFIADKIAWRNEQADYFNIKPIKRPFIIGISGSVSVGKSTTSRLLRLLFQRIFPDLAVHRMTTDGFLYSNDELISKNLMQRKGFPESYNMELLNKFLTDVISGKSNVEYPLYSQGLSDIVPDKLGYVRNPDVLIIEGINTLQLPPNGNIVTSDFFDFSIYLDAPENLIEKWFIHRFEELLDQNKDNPDNYYYKWANSDRKKAIEAAKKVWTDIDLVNLHEYIAPTALRANIILHKGENHRVNAIDLRRY